MSQREPDWPELIEWPELMPTEVSSDFVERTFLKVLEDQRRIAEEAARADEIHLPRDLLATYRPPEPSSDFSERVLARLRGRPDLPRLLAHYATPEPSADFVERTLAALRVPSRRPRRWLPAPIAALAAAVVLAVFLWPTPGPVVDTRATAYSPSPWATSMAAQGRDTDAPEPFAADPLVLLAMGTGEEQSR